MRIARATLKITWPLALITILAGVGVYLIYRRQRGLTETDTTDGTEYDTESPTDESAQEYANPDATSANVIGLPLTAQGESGVITPLVPAGAGGGGTGGAVLNPGGGGNTSTGTPPVVTVTPPPASPPPVSPPPVYTPPPTQPPPITPPPTTPPPTTTTTPPPAAPPPTTSPPPTTTPPPPITHGGTPGGTPTGGGTHIPSTPHAMGGAPEPTVAGPRFPHKHKKHKKRHK